MTYFYSPESKGFYNDAIHGVMPLDVFEISEEFYHSLMEGQSQGKIITYESRQLKLVDFVPPPMTWEQIRIRRNSLLSASDWTQLPDNQLSTQDRERWSEYRQTLRDITESFSDPDDVIWPRLPNQDDSEE